MLDSLMLETAPCLQNPKACVCTWSAREGEMGFSNASIGNVGGDIGVPFLSNYSSPSES